MYIYSLKPIALCFLVFIVVPPQLDYKKRMNKYSFKIYKINKNFNNHCMLKKNHT